MTARLWWTNFTASLTPNTHQKRILWILGGMLLVVSLMYQFRITRLVLYPFEIIGTVFHEFGHALACWMTGGKVHSIDINMDESGLTRFSGGWPCIILPAGYIGSSLIGCVLLYTGFSKRASRWMAGFVGIILAVTCFWAGTIMTLVMALVLAAILAFAVWFREGQYTQYIVLFMGTTASLISLLNILSSTVFHTIAGSDATAFAKQCSILIPAFVYGIIWLVISALIIALSICLAIRYNKE